VSTRTTFELSGGGSIQIEQASADGVTQAGRPRLEHAAATLRQSLDSVVGAASDMIEAFNALPSGPQEVEVQFGVSLDATVGAVLVSGTAGTHLDVTLRWRPQPVPSAAPAPETTPEAAPAPVAAPPAATR
jgi:Trypsin-co-occurring domain 1